MTHLRFTLHLRGGQKTLPGLVCANTAPEERPWRINIFDEGKTKLAFPHLTVTDFPDSVEELLWHLEAQFSIQPKIFQPIEVSIP